MTVGGTQGTAGEEQGLFRQALAEQEARTRELFRRATAVGQEWARAKEGGGPPDGPATERMLRELADAEQERDGAARRALRMARGTLLAVRHLADGTHGGAADPAGDRAEALVLLREAREPEPVTERETRSRTAVTKLLIRLLVPPSWTGRPPGSPPARTAATACCPGGRDASPPVARTAAPAGTGPRSPPRRTPPPRTTTSSRSPCPSPCRRRRTGRA
ncbi:hypothetical protein [Streptomyces sp. NPDC048737]|uniref:hypothetical protein n=1 Tax=unclassified Streptomyces TaxID=2593676 RepID=UPI003420B870